LYNGFNTNYYYKPMQRKILLYLLFVLLSANTNAQLNGVYTIGGTTPDYATFTDAVADLTSLGISGNVTFDVRSGTYAEKVSIPAIAGTSSIHTITFQSEVGDSSAVILVDTASTSSTNNYTLQLTDADYVTIKKMTIQRSGTGTYANVIAIGNNSVNNKFQNNHILGITATTSSTNNALIYAASGGTSIDSNNIFSNNFFENGSYGMYFNGQSAAVLEGRNSVCKIYLHALPVEPNHRRKRLRNQFDLCNNVWHLPFQFIEWTYYPK